MGSVMQGAAAVLMATHLTLADAMRHNMHKLAIRRQTHGSSKVTRARPPADHASQVTHTLDRASSRSSGSGGAGMRPLPRCGLTRKARKKAQA